MLAQINFLYGFHISIYNRIISTIIYIIDIYLYIKTIKIIDYYYDYNEIIIGKTEISNLIHGYIIFRFVI